MTLEGILKCPPPGGRAPARLVENRGRRSLLCPEARGAPLSLASRLGTTGRLAPDSHQEWFREAGGSELNRRSSAALCTTTRITQPPEVSTE